MRILLICFDGLGDRPARLGGLTPLEAAYTPHLDRLATEGINGLLHAKAPGYAIGSPLALHLLFGYPESEFPDRGPLLARARGVAVEPDEVVMAARFAEGVRDGAGLRLTRRFLGDRDADCASLADAIAMHEVDGVRFRYVYAGRGDGLLMMRGASHYVTDTDPLAIDAPLLRAQPRADAPDSALAAKAAKALSAYLRWVHARLREHPSAAREGCDSIATLLTKWAGAMPRYESFAERWGLRPAALPDEEVVSGLLLELGFRLEQIEGADPETDLRARLQGARALLEDGYEFIHLHTKYPDPMSHDNEPERARDAIAALDRAMAWYWDHLASDPTLITVLTTDHTTPSVWAEHPRGVFNDQHGGEPGPIVIRGGNVRTDLVREFGERPAAAGALGHLRGPDFMPVLLNAAERTNMWEMRPTAQHRIYRPRLTDLEPLALD